MFSFHGFWSVLLSNGASKGPVPLTAGLGIISITFIFVNQSGANLGSYSHRKIYNS